MKLIRLSDVLDRVPLGKTAVYKLIAEDEFPRPVKLGTASAWVEQEINEWIAERAARRSSSPRQPSS